VTAVDENSDGSSEGLTLTLPEAVTATGTSESTIRRRLREQAFPGAVRDPRGGWRLPVVDLRAAGFTVSGPLVEAVPAVTPAPEPVIAADPDQDAAGECSRRDNELTELRDLRRQNADLRERVGRAEATAEARAAELERALHIVDRLTRAVGAAPDDEPHRVVVHDAVTAAEQSTVVVGDDPGDDPGDDQDEDAESLTESSTDGPISEASTLPTPPRRGLLARLLGKL